MARSHFPVYGLNYEDKPGAARDWLKRLGNPYVATLVDADGATGINYGVYGVPETFVIDQAGLIRYRHAGPMTAEFLERTLAPLLRDLEREKDAHV